jgi:hypothetical protein
MRIWPRAEALLKTVGVSLCVVTFSIGLGLAMSTYVILQSVHTLTSNHLQGSSTTCFQRSLTANLPVQLETATPGKPARSAGFRATSA